MLKWIIGSRYITICHEYRQHDLLITIRVIIKDG